VKGSRSSRRYSQLRGVRRTLRWATGMAPGTWVIFEQSPAAGPLLGHYVRHLPVISGPQRVADPT
jgi:hypothetical protein